MDNLHSQRFAAFLAAPLAVLMAISVVAITTVTADTRTAAAVSKNAVASAAPASTNSDATTPERPVFDPTLDQQLADSPMTTVLVRLNTELTGTDAQRAAGARAAVAQLLATLPNGSYADVADSGVLPMATFQASRAAVDVLKNSPLVRAVGADEPMAIASSESTVRSGAATSNANSMKGDGTVVAVIDSGIQSTHPFLMRGTTSKVIGGACFTTPYPTQGFSSPCPNNTPTAINGPSNIAAGAACTWTDNKNGCSHGTHVAGVIAGEPGTPSFTDLSGVAPNTKLIAIQVFGYKVTTGLPPEVTSLTSDVLNSMKWLYNRRADFPGLSAVNISIASTSTPYPGICDTSSASTAANAAQQNMFAAVKALRDVGIATIVSAGNSSWNGWISSPACLSNTIGVGAIDDITGQRASFSNISTAISLFAPGASIPSSWPGFPTTPKLESGTSQAAPAVAGAWALMRQKYPTTMTSQGVTDILNLLRSTGTTVTTTVTPTVFPPGGPATTTNPLVTYTAPSININRALGTPVPTRIAAGTTFSCTGDSDGTVACSGSNDVGQLGINPTTATSKSTPVRVAGIAGAADITAGDNFACATISPGTAGTVKCWGGNSLGQLGNGSTTNAFTPVTVVNSGTTSTTTNLTGVSSVSSMSGSSCAVINAGASGTVKCWGANTSGQLGDASVTNRTRPVDVKASSSAVLTGVKAVSMGSGTACALMNTGGVKCWGSNTFGTLGNNTTTASTYPVDVSGFNGTTLKATSVNVGLGFACAVLTTGGLKCWGLNNYGQLGNNTTTNSSIPVDVKVVATPSPVTYANLAGVTAVSAGQYHACAIAPVAGVTQVLCWGFDGDRQLGGTTNGNRSVATAMFGAKSIGATALIASPFSTMIVVTNAIDAVGRNTSGQLGLGDTTSRITQTWSLRF
jgi:alpha-tubulin suppressor-like RCC1 family protein